METSRLHSERVYEPDIGMHDEGEIFLAELSQNQHQNQSQDPNQARGQLQSHVSGSPTKIAGPLLPLGNNTRNNNNITNFSEEQEQQEPREQRRHHHHHHYDQKRQHFDQQQQQQQQRQVQGQGSLAAGLRKSVSLLDVMLSEDIVVKKRKSGLIVAKEENAEVDKKERIKNPGNSMNHGNPQGSPQNESRIPQIIVVGDKGTQDARKPNASSEGFKHNIVVVGPLPAKAITSSPSMQNTATLDSPTFMAAYSTGPDDIHATFPLAGPMSLYTASMSASKQRMSTSGSKDISVHGQPPSGGASCDVSVHNPSGLRVRDISLHDKDISVHSASSVTSGQSSISVHDMSIVPVALDVTELRLLKDAFDRVDPERNGLNREKFKEVIYEFWSSKVKYASLDILFDLFDFDKTGKVNLKEFVCGYATLCRGTQEQRIRYLFHMFDDNNDGIINQREMYKVVKLVNAFASRLAGNPSSLLASRNFDAEDCFGGDITDSQALNRLASSAFQADDGTSIVTLDFAEFARFCTKNKTMSSWLDELSKVADESLETLRRIKEHEMLALELERMGLLDPVNQSERSANRKMETRPVRNADPDDRRSLLGTAPVVTSVNDSRKDGDVSLSLEASPQIPQHKLPGYLLKMEEKMGVSQDSLDLSVSPPPRPPVTMNDEEPMSERTSSTEGDQSSHSSWGRPGSRSGSSRKLGNRRNSISSVTRKKSFGPNLTVRRTNAPSSLADSPFVIDYESLRLKRIIGKGSFATVWSAEWLHMPVAVKVFHDQDETAAANEPLIHESVREKKEARYTEYLREIELLSQLRHPNVLLYMGACISPDKPFCIVTELYNGGSVHDLLDTYRQERTAFIKNNPDSPVPKFGLSPSEVLTLAVGVARGMLYLHSSNPIILHRDMKSSNILVDRTRNHCVICDFGLSRIDTLSSNVSADSDSATKLIGTPATMAPEIMEGSAYTPPADVYSFGVVLWEMWTCRKPFDGLKPIQLMFQVFSENARPEILPEDNFHPAILEVIQDCWDADPKIRPNFEEILEVLEDDVLQEEVIAISRQEKNAENQGGELLSLEQSRSAASKLLEAVSMKNIKEVQTLLDSGVPVNVCDYDKRTALHIAAADGDLPIVRLLLSYGAKVNACDRWNSNPLQDAVREGHQEIARILRDAGATDTKATPDIGSYTAQNLLSLQLMGCIHAGNVEEVERLLGMGASVEFADYDQRTSLHVAASEGYNDIVKVLLKHGANPEARDRWGSMPVHDAQRAGHREVEVLLNLAVAKYSIGGSASDPTVPSVDKPHDASA